MMGPSVARKFVIVGVALLPSFGLMRDSHREYFQQVHLESGGAAFNPRVFTRLTLPPWDGAITVPPGMGISIVHLERQGTRPDLVWPAHTAQCREWGVPLQHVQSDKGTLVASVCLKPGGVIRP
jgi:hypothetical protein